MLFCGAVCATVFHNVMCFRLSLSDLFSNKNIGLVFFFFAVKGFHKTFAKYFLITMFQKHLMRGCNLFTIWRVYYFFFSEIFSFGVISGVMEMQLVLRTQGACLAALLYFCDVGVRFIVNVNSRFIVNAMFSYLELHLDLF